MGGSSYPSPFTFPSLRPAVRAFDPVNDGFHKFWKADRSFHRNPAPWRAPQPRQFLLHSRLQPCHGGQVGVVGEALHSGLDAVPLQGKGHRALKLLHTGHVARSIRDRRSNRQRKEPVLSTSLRIAGTQFQEEP